MPKSLLVITFVVLLFNLTFLAGPVTADTLQTVESEKLEKPTLFFDLGSDGGWVPYRIGDEEGEKGILADLIELMESYSTINYQSVHLPMKRAEQSLIQGVVDFDFICSEWFPNGNIGDNFMLSDELFEINEYVITLKKNKELFPTLDSIYGHSVGTIGGYFYFDDDKFTRVDFIDENTLLKGLKHGRFKAIILEGETAKHWAKVNDVEIAFTALHSKGHLKMRLNKRNSPYLPEINETIKQIKTSGDLDKILKSHGLEIKR
ncbi:substrate-binding periplasmic protein [Glaciecola sp.]|uniref:substrate-binding periplasmic protein n=1 Tax=Glaciecola sp. MF2-115 TaxID=3384827 RepID=UPI00398A2F1D